VIILRPSRGGAGASTGLCRGELLALRIDMVRISKRIGLASPNITLAIYAHLFRKRDDVSAAAINGSPGKTRFVTRM